jgi:RNA polymerase sigma-70 factor (ECF subfamily)
MLKLAQKYAGRDSQEWGPLFHRILQNTIMDWHRRQKVRNTWRVFLSATGIGKINDPPDDGFATVDADEFRAKIDNNPALKLINERTLEALEAALYRLPVRQQQTFLLRIWEGLSVEETAEAMKCSQGSVKTHLSRAVKTLRDQLEDHRL